MYRTGAAYSWLRLLGNVWAGQNEQYLTLVSVSLILWKHAIQECKKNIRKQMIFYYKHIQQPLERLGFSGPEPQSHRRAPAPSVLLRALQEAWQQGAASLSYRGT